MLVCAYSVYAQLLLNHQSPSSTSHTHAHTHTHTHTDGVGDERLVLVRELLRTEDAYLENLKNIFDIYMKPLR